MSFVQIGVFAAIVVAIVFATVKAPRLTSVILWSLVATIFSTSALLLMLPGAFSEKALFLTVGVPLVWALYQFWCYWDSSKWRVVSGLIAISVVGGTIVFLTDPVV